MPREPFKQTLTIDALVFPGFLLHWWPCDFCLHSRILLPTIKWTTHILHVTATFAIFRVTLGMKKVPKAQYVFLYKAIHNGFFYTSVGLTAMFTVMTAFLGYDYMFSK